MRTSENIYLELAIAVQSATISYIWSLKSRQMSVEALQWEKEKALGMSRLGVVVGMGKLKEGNQKQGNLCDGLGVHI